MDLDATNIEVSSTQASMSLGEGKIKLIGGSTSTITVGASNSLTLSDDGTDRFLVIGSKSSFSQFDQSTAGIIFGTDNGTTKFEVVGDSDNYISFNGSSFDIKSETFDLATTNLLVESSTPQIRVGASNGQRVELKDASLVFKNPSQTDVLELTGSLTTIINVPTVDLSTGGNTTFTANGAIDISSAGAVRQAAGSGNFHEGYWDQNNFIVTVNNTTGRNPFNFVNYINTANKKAFGMCLAAVNNTGHSSASDNHTRALYARAQTVGGIGSGNFGQTIGAHIEVIESLSTSNVVNVIVGEYGVSNASAPTNGIRLLHLSGSGMSNSADEFGIKIDMDGGSSQFGIFSNRKIASQNDVIAFQSSDKRLKTNIQTVKNPLNKISKINGVSFEWKEGHDERIQNKTNLGVIAQEVQKVIPEVVKERDDGYLAVKYDQLVPVLIEAVKDQQKQIDDLKKKLEEL